MSSWSGQRKTLRSSKVQWVAQAAQAITHRPCLSGTRSPEPGSEPAASGRERRACFRFSPCQASRSFDEARAGSQTRLEQFAVMVSPPPSNAGTFGKSLKFLSRVGGRVTHSRRMAGNSWDRPLHGAVGSSASSPYGASRSRGVWQAAGSSWPARFTRAAGTEQGGCWGPRSLVAPAAFAASAHRNEIPNCSFV